MTMRWCARRYFGMPFARGRTMPGEHAEERRTTSGYENRRLEDGVSRANRSDPLIPPADVHSLAPPLPGLVSTPLPRSRQPSRALSVPQSSSGRSLQGGTEQLVSVMI
jgi:hypothetical protein